MRHTRFMDYSEAFPDLAGVLLEDSWVLDIAPSERAVSFQLDVVLTPDHPRHRPPTTGEQHCYLTGCPFTGPVELGRCAGFDLGGPCRRVGLILGL